MIYCTALNDARELHIEGPPNSEHNTPFEANRHAFKDGLERAICCTDRE